MKLNRLSFLKLFKKVMIITIIINTIMVGLMSQLSYKHLDHHKTRSVTDHDDLGRTWLVYRSIRNLNLLRPPLSHQCAHNNNSSLSVDLIYSCITVWGSTVRTLAADQFGAASISFSAPKGWGLSFCSVHWDLISPTLISAISMCASVQCPDLEHQMRSLGPHSEIPQ